MDFYEKSIAILELPAVLEMLAAEAVSAPPRRVVWPCGPATTPGSAPPPVQTSAARI